MEALFNSRKHIKEFEVLRILTYTYIYTCTYVHICTYVYIARPATSDIFKSSKQNSKPKFIGLFCHISVKRNLKALALSFALSLGKSHCRSDRLYIYSYICIFICIYIYVYIHSKFLKRVEAIWRRSSILANTLRNLRSCIIHTYVYIYAYKCIHLYIYIYICTYNSIYAIIYIYIYISYVCMYIFM